jgi:hypothetical protein
MPQHPVNTRARHAEALGDFGRAEAIRPESADLRGVYRGRAALVDALRLRGCDPFELALAPQVRLELGKDAEHVEKRLAGRR